MTTCTDTLDVDDMHACRLDETHALTDAPHRDGSIAWTTSEHGQESWIDSTPIETPTMCAYCGQVEVGETPFCSARCSHWATIEATDPRI